MQGTRKGEGEGKREINRRKKKEKKVVKQGIR